MLGDGTLTNRYTSDFRDHLTGETVQAVSFIKDVAYVRKADGRVSEITDNLDAAQTMNYYYGDDLTQPNQGYRLLQVERGGNTEEEFSYDIMGNDQGTVIEVPFTPVTNTDIHNWTDLTGHIQTGHWWRENPYLNTSNKDLIGNIQLLTDNGDVREFQAVVDTSSGQLYTPVLARMYFSYTDANNYRYAGIRTQVVAVDNNGEDMARQLLMIEIGSVSGGQETILAQFEQVLDTPAQTVNLDLSITKDAGTYPANLTWSAGTANGSIDTTFASTIEGKAGFIVSKTGAYSAKFTNVNIAGVNVTPSNEMNSPVYKYQMYNSKACVWDNNGNLTQFGSGQFIYDSFNRMKEANGVKYIYDAQNRRIAKVDGGDTYLYIYHGWSVIAEYKNGTLQREFIEGISTDEHLCMVDGATGDKYYYVLDTRNGVDRIVDDTGALVERYQYSAYGEASIFDNLGDPVSDSTISNPYRFQGRRFDTESDLMYFRNRQYSPEMKRFVSMDPLGFIDSMNLYETFGCDPVNYIDPSGLWGGMGFMKMFKEKYGDETYTALMILMAEHNVKIKRGEAIFDDWWFKNNTIFINEYIGFGSIRGNENATRQLNQALNRTFGIGHRDWLTVTSDVIWGGVKMVGGTITVAAGAALIKATGGLATPIGWTLVVTGGATIVEGGTQLFTKQGGINPGEWVAEKVAGDAGVYTYRVLDIGVNLVGGAAALHKASKVQKFRIFAKVEQVKWAGKTKLIHHITESGRRVMMIVKNTEYKLQIVGHTIEVIAATGGIASYATK